MVAFHLHASYQAEPIIWCAVKLPAAFSCKGAPATDDVTQR